ncbi:putative myeloid zinc finger 1-like [Penaeus vannamei]|uniref:Putative myeloid zinc finger 1-like n=1 Tax=Penaeus vannamei TaxID=6689 RepID=A0A3R7MZ49_PENVA|nr:putative myeloid zinc finger 1-like [Penaeus vannamei]
MSRLYMTHAGAAAPGEAPDLSPFSTEPPAHHVPHSCKFCGKLCDTPSQLAIHLRAHTGERPFCCPHCDYRATQKHHVKSHLQRRHKELVQDPEAHLAAQPRWVLEAVFGHTA